MKASTTIIGHGDSILIPEMSNKTTGEAELGIIIGKQCKNVREKDWLEVVAGFVPLIDMTAEDILRQNPRYLTLSKNFDTFFSFGPQILTPEEVNDINQLKVRTVINDQIHAENLVANMTFSPAFLVSFHSQIMTLMPGDIICTGTPRAVALSNGDTITCEIDGFPKLSNPIKDTKSQS
jgi:2-keto-4-pentenoate hydratase/2-oxohepta-3-ene-1,7-dioic acid hydratase in catechol pathway